MFQNIKKIIFDKQRKYKKKHKYSFVYANNLYKNGKKPRRYIHIGYFNVEANKYSSIFWIKRLGNPLKYIVFNIITRDYSEYFFTLREAKAFVISNIRDTIRYMNMNFME